MDFITQNFLLITLVLVSGAGIVWQYGSLGARKQVSPAEATLLINREDAQIIDVRDASEFAAGHLANATNIPLANLVERMAEIEKLKDKTLIVCCAAGMRSNKGCGVLAKQGFSKAHSLAGGVDAWVAAGYPVKKGGRNK